MQFEGPLPRHTKLSYYECYAKILLEQMFSKKYFDLIIEDEPDLQSKSLSLGIEVTSATGDEKLDRIYADYINNRVRDKKKTLCEIEKCGGKIHGGILSSCGIDSIELVLKAFATKMLKLNSGNYRVLAETDLLVFSDILADDDMCCFALKSMIEESNKNIRFFSRVFVAVPDYLYIFDIDRSVYEAMTIDSSLQFACACDARKMVEENEVIP